MSIASARRQAGYTQEESAKRLKVSKGAVGQWEAGFCKPKTARLIEIASLYGCTVDELLKPDGKENKN